MTKKNRKKAVGKPSRITEPNKNNKNIKYSWIWLIIIVTLLIAISFFIKNNDNLTSKTSRNNKKFEPEFKSEGDLSFYKVGQSKPISTITIEIADNEYERMLGMMYRRSMSDTMGMLFIMEREEPQSFWMRNTYISLDIIYLDIELSIVSIQKYTVPFSENPIPSIYKSKYVVEVVAGYCDNYNIAKGDYVKFRQYKKL